MSADGPGAVSADRIGTSGSIYDLGYQRYRGQRLGRAYAFRSLYLHGLAASFGIGRSTRSKVIPIGLFAIALVPALIELGVTALAGEALRPVRLDNYFSLVGTVMVLFGAAVAPELGSRDQRHHVLSLYFSRALERRDYAVARLAALLTAMLAIALIPEFVLYLGTALVRSDPVSYLSNNADQPGLILGSGIVVALQVTGVALAIASLTPRRAYATGGIVAYWFIADGLGSLIASITPPPTAAASQFTSWTHDAVLLSPSLVGDGAVRWFFGTAPEDALARADLAGWVYVLAALVYAAIGIAVVLRRFHRIAA